MSTPDKDDLPVLAWKVIAKGGKFSRGIYDSERKEWELDGDTQVPLCSRDAALAQIAELRGRLERAEAKYGYAIACSCGPHTLVTTEPDLPAHQPNWSQAISDEAFNAAIAAAKAKT